MKKNLKKILIILSVGLIMTVVFGPRLNGKIDRWLRHDVYEHFDQTFQVPLEAAEREMNAHPDDASRTLVYANSLRMSKDYNLALKYYLKAVQFNKKNETVYPENIYCELGKCYFKLKRYVEAKESFDKVIRLKPRNEAPGPYTPHNDAVQYLANIEVLIVRHH